MLSPSAQARVRRLAATWRGLTTRDRLVLTLLLYERLTPIEASCALGCPLGEVLRIAEARLPRLRRAIRRVPRSPARRRVASARPVGQRSRRRAA